VSGRSSPKGQSKKKSGVQLRKARGGGRKNLEKNWGTQRPLIGGASIGGGGEKKERNAARLVDPRLEKGKARARTGGHGEKKEEREQRKKGKVANA